MRTILDRLFERKTKEEPQSKHTKVIAPEDLQILYSILKQIGSLKIYHDERLLFSLFLSDDKEGIDIHCDKHEKPPKRVAKILDEWKLNTVQQELQQRIGKDIAIIQAILQTLPERLALLSTKEETASLKKSLKDIIQNATKANSETVLQAMEEKQPSSIATKEDLDKAFEKFFTRFIDHLRTIVLEMTTAKLEAERTEYELIKENAFDLVYEEFYSAVVDTHKDYGFFVRLLDKHGKKRKLQGLVHKSNIPTGKTINNFPKDLQVTVKYIGFKEEDGEIKLAFSVPDSL